MYGCVASFFHQELHTYLYICISRKYVCVQICKSVCVCLYVYTHIYIYTYIYIYMYTCVTHTTWHTRTHFKDERETEMSYVYAHVCLHIMGWWRKIDRWIDKCLVKTLKHPGVWLVWLMGARGHKRHNTVYALCIASSHEMGPWMKRVTKIDCSKLEPCGNRNSRMGTKLDGYSRTGVGKALHVALHCWIWPEE